MGAARERLQDAAAGAALHVTAQHDHFVPKTASRPLIDMIGSTYKEAMALKGGHVSLVAGGNAIKRLWPRIDAWLGERSA